MKKIINDPKLVVDEMLQGMALAHSEDLTLLAEPKVIVRKKKTPGKVAIISGGGSGHEPAHAGYVGKGMLDAAVSGNVFASPAPDQVFEGIMAAENGAGVLMVIKNYSGDIMNFDMAKELAEMEDIEVDFVVVDDDVAISKDAANAGRRGIAGTIFVHKIAGAKAERGATLSEVKATAEKVIANMRSMGMSLSPCTVPEAGKVRFTIGEDEMEIGMGIHGESGVIRTKIATADEIAEQLLVPILKDMPVSKGEEVAVLVNGLGATPLMELYIVNKRIHELLTEAGIKVYKTMVGNYMTSLEMAGCSVTILKLDDELKQLLLDPAHTPGLTVD